MESVTAEPKKQKKHQCRCDMEHPDMFEQRHIGPDAADAAEMFKKLGVESLDELIDQTIPKKIRLKKPLKNPIRLSEHESLAQVRSIAARNKIFRSYIGLGYHETILPGVIQRNILENPGWYTQYTPYQAEISQGRLEALLNFQTMVCDLTGMEIANASLLDESTAAAEAMMMCHRLHKGEANAFFISESCHPQTIAVVQARAEALGIEILVGDHRDFDFSKKIFGALVQYPATDGIIFDFESFIQKTHERGALAVVAADILSLTLLKSPGELGADVVVGNTQRFGMPPGFGGPHAAFFATRKEFQRQMPGRLVGVSKDSDGKFALRLSLQTREQHIRRERATSNICTAQVLPAVVASMYAVYHGPGRLGAVARRIYLMANTLAEGLERLGYEVEARDFFDTVKVRVSNKTADEIIVLAEKERVNLRKWDERTVLIALGETTAAADVKSLWKIFNGGKKADFKPRDFSVDFKKIALARESAFLTHPVFNRRHSETEMLRYIKKLESRDLSLTHSMIPLGSCTMKLNPAAAMMPITWPKFSQIHPFAPLEQAEGYLRIIRDLENWLREVTGFDAVSLQPNSGAQGEYAGLLVIRKFHQTRGEPHRTVCLIPSSAHGTNPASAAMAGMRVVVTQCDEKGNIDLEDLRVKAEEHRENLSACMITYPSTHGVFEENIQEACRIIHENGGQVYMDGANMNAQVGLCSPSIIGADVCHINLHKTFAVPHGGGGPGMGPIAVAEHLSPFLPGHPLVEAENGKQSIGPVSETPWGSGVVLIISWMYIQMMGADGLTNATKYAILNANYIAARLDDYFPVLYKGPNGRVAHECILDLRQFKESCGVEAEDVAKRLMDYGFHAPTMSFPVPGTLMVEPTESESKEELDRFCEAMIEIHREIKEIESGQLDARDHPLKNAPHTAEQVISDEWDRPYSRERAAFPLPWVRENKFWPVVSRIDNVYGDRNLEATLKCGCF